MTTTDKHTPPNLSDNSSVFYWERSLDPWHIDAFPTEFDPKTATIVAIGAVNFSSDGPRGEGWMGIDWCENPIGYVPDGTDIGKRDNTKYVFRTGPYGHLCAYPEDSPKLEEHEGQDWTRKS